MRPIASCAESGRCRTLVGVRLDSGDMVNLSKTVRKILNDEGFPEVKIFASSGFDEFKIARVISEGARIAAVRASTGACARRPRAT